MGLRLAVTTTREFMALVLAAARERSLIRVGYLNAANVNRAFESAEFARMLARMDCLYADGKAVVWAARWRGAPVPERINAGDFTREFIRETARSGLKLALVGGRPASGQREGEADLAADVFRSWAPELKIALTQHGYFSEMEAESVREALERADPDIVLLGMGAPRQERWAIEWSPRGRPRVWWCVGALFEYYAGTRRRAPVWMRRAGLEWLFRLVLEPGRLWKRYLVGNPLFIWRVLRGRPPRGLSTHVSQ